MIDDRIWDSGQKLDLLGDLITFARACRGDAYAELQPPDRNHKRAWYLRRDGRITEEKLRAHLNGGPHLGAYLLPDGSDRTRLAVFDLDDHDGTVEPGDMRNTAQAVRAAAFRRGVFTWPVRSGGGDGIHVCIQWTEPQGARDVRALMHAILADVGLRDGTSGIASGEVEVFPKQATVEKGGYGSLIALPFGRKSVPLDEDMLPAERPIQFASTPQSPPPAPVNARTEPEPALSGEAKAVIEDVAAALAAIPNGADVGFGDYVAIGMAVFSSTGGSDDGLAAWEHWARAYPDYKVSDTEKRWSYWRRRSPTGTGFGALVKRARRHEPGWRPPGDKGIETDIAELNEDHALVLIGDKAVVLRESVSSEQRPEMKLLTVSAFKTWLQPRRVFVGDKLMPLAEAWLRDPRRRQYDGLVFSPEGQTPGYYNLWRGFGVDPRPGDCSKFLAHLRDNVARGDEELFNWVVGWFAAIFQKPGEKVGTSLAIRGKMGTGKTKTGEVIGSLLGDHYLPVADPRYVTGRFNSHLVSCVLLHADEGFWAGDRGSEGKLKDLVTGAFQWIEYKGKEAFRVRNHVRLLVTGNPDWIVPAGLEERRFAVLEIGEERIGDHAYFAAIDAEMANGGREALLDYLLRFDLSRVNLRVIPRTAALEEQKIASMSPEQGWWLDLLHRGEMPGDVDGGGRCPTKLLFLSYIEHAQQQGVRHRSIETRVGIFLRKAAPELKKCQDERYAPKCTVYAFPPLAACRKTFERMMQTSINWSGDPENWCPGETVERSLF